MTRTLRIGLQFAVGDPFWVLVREAIHQRANQLNIPLIHLEWDLVPLAPEERVTILEECLAQDLDALIAAGVDHALANLILDAGVPLVLGTEIDLIHPHATSPYGLYEAATIGASYLAERLNGRGRILLVGGLHEGFEKGESRLAGCYDALRSFPDIRLIHRPAPWTYEAAYRKLSETWQKNTEPFDGIFGLSDSLALAGRDAARAAGLATDATLVVGINGDPLALTAILEGSMAATVETPAAELGRQLMDFAFQAATGEPLPPHFSYKPRLVTTENAGESAAEKLVTSATVPSRLVGFNREQEKERLRQLETTLAISQRIGVILDRGQLSREIAEIIRTNYDYDRVQIYRWLENEKALVLAAGWESRPPGVRLSLADAGALGETLLNNQPTFIPDMQHSHRYARDPRAPDCRARVILPIRFGHQVLGLLDLQSDHSTHHSRLDLVGLEALGDYFGVAIRNTELYGEAIAAQEEAARANELKSRLLANVSHELRTPLNIIQGYSQTALSMPNPYGVDLPVELLRDLRHIYQSGNQLGWLINDLLDLSRAEISDLSIFPERIATGAFLADIFQAMMGSLPVQAEVKWRLELPEPLPEIKADPVRLRQIVLNLLSNAHKFTQAGHITLGALPTTSHLHLWVDDTGCGIPLERQKHIFRAFITAEGPRRASEGIGLGLRMTHELVKLHDGAITFTSLPGVGATFHIYLPLPEPENHPRSHIEAPQSALPGIADLPPSVSELTRQTVSYLRQHYADTDLSRSQMATHIAVSESYLTRVFRRDLGISPREYLVRYRVARAKELLRLTNHSVTEIAHQIGYDDSAYFSRVFREETGRSPLVFRRQVR